jgi:hypothetical protein
MAATGDHSQRRVGWEGLASIGLILTFVATDGIRGFFGTTQYLQPGHFILATMVGATVGISVSGIRCGGWINRFLCIFSLFLSLGFVLFFAFVVVIGVLAPYHFR